METNGKHERVFGASSERQQRWPRYAEQARKRTEKAADDYAELLRQVLAHARQAQDLVVAGKANTAIEELLHSQRDIALTIAGLTDIKNWMLEARRGRPSALDFDDD